jgi:5S rRNA maturation endonuclease (ribonuclease M5)
MRTLRHFASVLRSVAGDPTDGVAMSISQAKSPTRTFPPEFLDELRARTPIASLIGRTVKLARAGTELKGCCPFHNDKSPSFTVYPSRFHCFGCGKNGETQHVEFKTAVVQLAADVGLPLPDTINARTDTVNGNGGHHSSAAKEVWLPLVPPPPDVPQPTKANLRCDKIHTYRDANGMVLFYIRRFEARKGKRKAFIPLTYGTFDGKLGWHPRAPNGHRPLYCLNQMAAHPDAPVIVCEGEKAADAAHKLFPSHVCVTWSGGADAVGKTDWQPLIDRRTEKIIWPDNDEQGHKAAAKIAALLPGARVLRVDDLPEKHDAADVQLDDPQAWLLEHLPPGPEPVPSLCGMLSADAWIHRIFPPSEQLLGDLLTTKSRVFMVGYTGLGKTMLGLAMAVGIATGNGFLHWRSGRPARVLYIDGEMPGELLQARIQDAVKRSECERTPANLFAYSADWSEAFAKYYPSLGTLAPLNTEQGQQFIYDLIAELGGIDAVFFDNVMSLVIGDQKDEIPWSETLPLVTKLTAKGIAQVWFDHTGHNAGQQYGSSTKAWRFDAVGIMTRLGEDQRASRETAFTLSFEPPGKARRRTPENWDQFAPHVIRLQDRKTINQAVSLMPPRPCFTR